MSWLRKGHNLVQSRLCKVTHGISLNEGFKEKGRRAVIVFSYGVLLVNSRGVSGLESLHNRSMSERGVLAWSLRSLNQIFVDSKSCPLAFTWGDFYSLLASVDIFGGRFVYYGALLSSLCFAGLYSCWLALLNSCRYGFIVHCFGLETWCHF